MPNYKKKEAKKIKRKGTKKNIKKRSKNKANDENDENRELIFKQDGQDYAQVIRMHGFERCEARCSDNVRRLCHVHGKMRRVWISAGGHVILIARRGDEDDTANVIHMYTFDECVTLKNHGELGDNIRFSDIISYAPCEICSRGACDDESVETIPDDYYIEFEGDDIDFI